MAGRADGLLWLVGFGDRGSRGGPRRAWRVLVATQPRRGDIAAGRLARVGNLPAEGPMAICLFRRKARQSPTAETWWERAVSLPRQKVEGSPAPILPDFFRHYRDIAASAFEQRVGDVEKCTAGVAVATAHLL
jgi:hypothetical protein